MTEGPFAGEMRTIFVLHLSNFGRMFAKAVAADKGRPKGAVPPNLKLLPMHVMLIAPKLAGAVTGLYAALLWWRASRVPTLPGFALDGRSEPVDPELKHMDALAGIMQTAAEAGTLNARAALWTAWAVGTNAVVSFWPQ